MAYKYSKLGYGNAEDVEAAIALGLIDGKDIIITKDSTTPAFIGEMVVLQVGTAGIVFIQTTITQTPTMQAQLIMQRMQEVQMEWHPNGAVLLI